jgi:hypothetical protein
MPSRSFVIDHNSAAINEWLTLLENHRRWERALQKATYGRYF